MILAFDIGNTHIVTGLYEKCRLVQSWRIDSNPHRTVDDYGHLVLYMVDRLGSLDRIEGAVIGSVVPPLTYVFDKLCLRYLDVKPRMIDGRSELGLLYEVDSPPEKIGGDRIANAFAVRERYGEDSIVVDVGTATTFDLVTGDGRYQGGIIAPGIKTCADALMKKAAMLPRIEIEAPPHVAGRDTTSMMQSGVFWGAICQIDGLVARLREEWKKDCRVIATGGFVSMLTKFSSQVDTADANLTLDGLCLAYHYLEDSRK